MNEMQEVEVRAMFYAGVPVDRIRGQYKTTRGNIGRTIADGPPPEINNKQIVALYNAGSAIDRIGVIYSVDPSVIRNILEKLKIKVPDTGGDTRVYNFDESYFSKIDTEDKAYWLGFLFGNGNVSQNLSHITITLKSGDVEHLKKLLECIGYDGGVEHVLYVLGSKTLHYDTLALHSKKMGVDLFARGCVPVKSLIVEPPNGLPKKYERDFIRGLWDADGTILMSSVSSDVSLCGSSVPLLQWVLNRMPPVGAKISPVKFVWRLRANSLSNGIKWIDYLYRDSNIYLDRKHNKAMEASNGALATGF